MILCDLLLMYSEYSKHVLRIVKMCERKREGEEIINDWCCKLCLGLLCYLISSANKRQLISPHHGIVRHEQYGSKLLSQEEAIVQFAFIS